MSGEEVRIRQGIGVCAPGIARGVVFIHHPDDEEPPKRRIEDFEVAKRNCPVRVRPDCHPGANPGDAATDCRSHRSQGREHF